MRDDPVAIAKVLRALTAQCDLVVTTGGASVGEEDHSAAAMKRSRRRGSRRSGSRSSPASRRSSASSASCAYLGLPGNPVSALVSWLFLGGAVVAALEQRRFRRRLGCPMPSTSQFQRRPGRTEFVPARARSRRRRSGRRNPGARRLGPAAAIGAGGRSCRDRAVACARGAGRPRPLPPVPQRFCDLSASLRATKNVPDFSILEDGLRELAKAQMVVGAAAITSVALANGDIVVSVMAAPGAENLPYARIDRASKRLHRITSGSPLTGE